MTLSLSDEYPPITYLTAKQRTLTLFSRCNYLYLNASFTKPAKHYIYRNNTNLAKWYILWVYCPSVYAPPRSGYSGWTPSSLANFSFIQTSIPSPPPVSFLLAWATEYSCAIWYYIKKNILINWWTLLTYQLSYLSYLSTDGLY